MNFFKAAHIGESAHQSVCSWKGTARYFDVIAGDAVNANAAWYYAAPKDAAKEITGRVAFWKGVTVILRRTPFGGVFEAFLRQTPRQC